MNDVEFTNDKKLINEINKEIKEDKKNDNYKIFSRRGQVESFHKLNLFFYDKSRMFWLWNKEEIKWEKSDEIDFLNLIQEELGVDTINSKTRVELIEAFKQVGRKKHPKEMNKDWIQFKDKIIEIKTGKEFESSPKYFTTNPIPWKIGESEETPRIDKLFKEWVGEKYVSTLYEIIAYSSCSDQFLQRMIALVGGGSNGKGTYIKLLKKFVGKENCVASEMRILSENQFETSALYKKLVCIMGEVSHDDLKNSNQIKKLSGEDDMRYCFKGKDAFTDESSTTCLINTNSLPTTKDKTVGFYRRWLIIDFPNQFPIVEGIIESVPEKEFENAIFKEEIKIVLGRIFNSSCSNNFYSFINDLIKFIKLK